MDGLTCLGVNVGDLFDRTSFAGLAMFGSHNATVCTLTELLHEGVLRVDDEG